MLLNYLEFCPALKLVAVSNLIGHHNLRNESDIDIFIVSSPHRLWLARFFCTGLMKIANQRPTKYCKRNKMCLSFYTSVDGLCDGVHSVLSLTILISITGF